MIAIVIPGTPIPKARARTTRFGTHTPEKTKQAEERAVYYWQKAGSPCMPPRTPLMVDLVFRFKRSPSHTRKDGSLTPAGVHAGVERPISKALGDGDNLEKLVLDALNGRAYEDDSLIVDQRARKFWADDEHPESTVILIRPIPQEGP